MYSPDSAPIVPPTAQLGTTSSAQHRPLEDALVAAIGNFPLLPVATISAGAAVWAAVETGRSSPSAVVVTVLPDGGHEPSRGGKA
jgi:hypothetical protein